MYTIEEYDTQKTKILKYVLYKKRTLKEIKIKFKNSIDEQMLEDILEELQQNGYIGDEKYIERAMYEYMALKNLSIKELRYKLLAKGIENSLIEEYFLEKREELEEYEKKCAENIVTKKSVNREETEIVIYLRKKGYKEENIQEAITKIKT